MPHPQHQTDQSANLASSVAAKPHIHVKNVQPEDKHATTVTNSATFQVSANRLPGISDPLDHHANSPSGQILSANTFVWLIRMRVRPSPLKAEYCTSIASPYRTRDTRPHTAHASSPVPDKGHFVLLDLKSPDSNHTIQVPFQIDSAVSCNTLPIKHLSSMPWATVIPTRTIIIPNASPPIQPIGQTTIEACKNNPTCNLTFQIVDTDQPALLRTEANKTLGVLTLNADFIRKCTTATPLSHPAANPSTCNYSAAEPSRYLHTLPSERGPNWELSPWSSSWRTVSHCFKDLVSLGPLSISIWSSPSTPQFITISKLESIKTALDTYETTGQLVRVSQPTDWISNMVVQERERAPLPNRENPNMPRPFSDS